MRLSQTSIIAASIVLAFFVFIVVRGELPGYFAVFTGAAPASGAGTTGPTQADFPITGGKPGILVGPGGVSVSYPNGLPK